MTSSTRVESADRATQSARGPHIAGHVSRGATWRTRSPGTRAHPDELTCSSKRHRCQCRVPQRPERRPRRKTGVVSRVPCSSCSAQAFGTDRNTNLTSIHQRQRTDTQGQLTDRRMGNPQKPAQFRWGQLGTRGHRAKAEVFGVCLRGQAGDTRGQVAATIRSATNVALSPLVPTSNWVRGDTETRVIAGVPGVPTCPRTLAAACKRFEKLSFIRRRPTCS